MDTLKTLDEALDSCIAERLTESVLPGAFEGMYYQRGTDFYQVKKTGNRFFYYSRRQASWMPVKKAEVKYTDFSWEELAKEIAQLGK